ncbi:MAG: hypothetical protein KAY32_05645 [Candidatus Eisenbacteria sp.]|nr:hypothetical protein [Candidatus Eisenbacteria bacterium]
MMIDEFGDDLIVVEYHGSASDPYYLPWSNQRMSFYGAGGYPTVVIDGRDDIGGSYGSCVANANVYRSTINNRIAETGGQADVSVTGVYTMSLTTISLSATVKLEEAVSLNTPMLVVAVLEDGFQYGGRHYDNVVRTGGGQYVELINIGDEATVTLDFNVKPEWDPEKIHCVAWVQKGGGNLLMYQAARLPLVIDFAFSYDDKMVRLLDGNDEAIFEATVENTSDVTDTLTLTLSDTFGWPTDFKLEGGAYGTDAIEVELDPGGTETVYLRVTTDSDVRIGEGGVYIESAVSGRVALKKGCVFNGSWAILFVDDDGTYPHQEEDPLLSALDLKNYLYEHWDLRKGYGGRAPTVEEMIEYDAVIWHPGRQNGMLLVDEVQLMSDYLDAGGGLVLSYQQYLYTADTSSSPVDSIFVADYLGIDSYLLDVGADSLLGVPGDPVSDGMAINFEYNSEVHDKPDEMIPNATGTICFTSPEDEGIVIRADHGDARVVYFACYLNAIKETDPNPDNLNSLLASALQWVIERGSADVTEDIRLVPLSAIRAISPNPFRIGAGAGMSTVRLRISDEAGGRAGRLDVFDLNGRLVRNLLDGPLSQGTTVTQWDGRATSGAAVGAGVYYIRFQTAAGDDRAPIVVLR